jgi:hypothetical protein
MALLPQNADHYRAAVNHIEFNRCGAADIDNASATVRPAIHDTHEDRLAVADVCNKTTVPNGKVR